MDWLNANSGAVQALATVVLVVVTAVYAGMVYWQVRETRRQGRPYVYIDVLNNTGFLETRITNVGLRPARNVQVEILKDVPMPGSEDVGFLSTPMLMRPVSVLGPNQEIKETVAYFGNVSGPLRQMEADKRILEYKVVYDDGSEKFREQSNFDLSHLLLQERSFPEPTLYDAIGELRDYVTTALNRTGNILDGIAETLEKRSDT